MDVTIDLRSQLSGKKYFLYPTSALDIMGNF